MKYINPIAFLLAILAIHFHLQDAFVLGVKIIDKKADDNGPNDADLDALMDKYDDNESKDKKVKVVK